MSRARVLGILAVAVCVACGSNDGGATNTAPPPVSISATSLTLVSGDSSTLTIISTHAGTVRWATSNAAVVTIDTLVSINDAATVRARGTGSAVLTATIRVDNQTYTTGVPVRVGSG